jgi:SNF2 family DNA or RNA helicase
MILLSKIGAGACLADDMGLGKTLTDDMFSRLQKETKPQYHPTHHLPFFPDV